MKKPLLSIAVPTKNRYDYLEYLIQLFLKIGTEEMELVIQDNSENPFDFKENLDKIKDSRIRYFYKAESISVVENCNLAIKNCNGEFITMIGDDDGFHRDIIHFVRYMKLKQIDSLIGDRAYYNWPGAEGYLFDFTATLRLKKYDTHIYKVDNRKLLNRMIKSCDFRILDMLPGVYNGIVSKQCLNKIYDITGSYFPGPSPDMANSTALSLIPIKHYKVKFPFSIAGKCSKSAGGLGLKHKHVSTIEEVRFLPKDTKERWNNKIPQYWLPSTIYAQSIIDALIRMDENDLTKKFNFDALLGRIFIQNFDIYKKTKHKNYIKNIKFWRGAISILNQRFNSLIKNILFNYGFSKEKKIKNISNIIECEKILSTKTKFNR